MSIEPSHSHKNHSSLMSRLLVMPSVSVLLLWMIVPLVMTLYFSLIRYNLLYPDDNGFVALENYRYFIDDPGFWPGISNTLTLVGSVLLITVVFGILISVLVNTAFWGQGIVRVLLISPFFIMPTVNALVWKNLLLHPVSRVFAHIWRFFGAQPVDWFAQFPLFSIIMIVSW